MQGRTPPLLVLSKTLNCCKKEPHRRWVLGGTLNCGKNSIRLKLLQEGPPSALCIARRKLSAIGPQQDLKLLQERTPPLAVLSTTLNCCRREPLRSLSCNRETLRDRSSAWPQIAARRNPSTLCIARENHSAIAPQQDVKLLHGRTPPLVVPSKALNCCKREPFRSVCSKREPLRDRSSA